MNSKIKTIVFCAVLCAAAFAAGCKFEDYRIIKSLSEAYDSSPADHIYSSWDHNVSGGSLLSPDNPVPNESADAEKTAIEPDVQNELARLEASSLEDHSDWLDCYEALSFINEHLREIERIDTRNPVPTIYFYDGSVYEANESHSIEQVKPPVETTPPPMQTVPNAGSDPNVIAASYIP